jgi:transcriptional regulator with XRE-family HTH domain
MIEALKQARIQLGLTQVELAQQSGVSLLTVQNIENGRANPSLETLEALAKSLNLKLILEPQKTDWNKLSFFGAPLTLGENLKVMILAIRDHYPSVFRDYFRNSPAIVQLIPKKMSGRLIKLRRLALSRMAEYL